MTALIVDEQTASAAPAEGVAMHALLQELYPLTRSITGAGLRATVRRLGVEVPLDITEVPSGTTVFDWSVPDEWVIEDAYIEHESGRRFAQFREMNLHVVGYSTPIDAVMTLDELRPHLHSLPDQPEFVPFVNSYYKPGWGFCLAHREFVSLPQGKYRVVIRSRIYPGSLTLAEHVHSGSSPEEILIFAHDCHPSLANDNLSGLVVAARLAKFLAKRKTRYTYRFLFAPATIGSITWLATNERKLPNIRHGLVLSLLGDGGPLHYKKSRGGKHAVDRAAWHVLRTEFPSARLLEFSPWGYDERQFCSPGINLPMGRLTRTPNGEFIEYHTSGDNIDFVLPQALGESWLACLKIFEALEADTSYVNLSPKGEPQLGRRGLYRSTGGYYTDVPDRQMALFWMLNQSDGSATLLDIAEKSGLSAGILARAAIDLQAAGLLQKGTVAQAGPP